MPPRKKIFPGDGTEKVGGGCMTALHSRGIITTLLLISFSSNKKQPHALSLKTN
jgi:hypothetical protein